MMGQYVEDVSPQRDRWLLSYADLLTLLLAFFVVMYSVSSVDEKKLHDIASSIEAEMIGTISNEALDIQGVIEPLDINIPNAVFKKQNNDWIEFTLKSEFLFASGEADLRLDVSDTLNDLLLILNSTKGDIRVEGHTDDNAISTTRFPSNWELSAARAAAVVRFFEARGVDSSRLSATGLSSSVPVASNSSSEGRRENRRVVLKIRALDGDLEKLGTLQYGAIEDESVKDASLEGSDNLFSLEGAGIGTNQRATTGIDSLDLDSIDPDLLLQILNEINADANQKVSDNE